MVDEPTQPGKKTEPTGREHKGLLDDPNVRYALNMARANLSYAVTADAAITTIREAFEDLQASGIPLPDLTIMQRVFTKLDDPNRLRHENIQSMVTQATAIDPEEGVHKLTEGYGAAELLSKDMQSAIRLISLDLEKLPGHASKLEISNAQHANAVSNFMRSAAKELDSVLQANRELGKTHRSQLALLSMDTFGK